MKLRLILAAVGRSVLGAAGALTFILGAYDSAFAQQISLGDGRYWTVLTMASGGSWGTATESEINKAIASAIARCAVISGARLGCGAQFVTIRQGWGVGFRCGNENILVAASTLADAERAAAIRESERRRLYVPDMPPCRSAVAVNPSGVVAAPIGPDPSSSLVRLR